MRCSRPTSATMKSVLLFVLLGCADPMSPAHDIEVESNCSGEWQSTQFHFEDKDFENSCIFDPPCFHSQNGRYVGGATDVTAALFWDVEKGKLDHYSICFEWDTETNPQAHGCVRSCEITPSQVGTEVVCMYREHPAASSKECRTTLR